MNIFVYTYPGNDHTYKEKRYTCRFYKHIYHIDLSKKL